MQVGPSTTWFVRSQTNAAQREPMRRLGSRSDLSQRTAISQEVSGTHIHPLGLVPGQLGRVRIRQQRDYIVGKNIRLGVTTGR